MTEIEATKVKLVDRLNAMSLVPAENATLDQLQDRFGALWNMIQWCEENSAGTMGDYRQELKRIKDLPITWPVVRIEIDPADPDWGMYATCNR